jgi:hypothetical protein
MKTALAVVFFAASAFAQDQSAVAAAESACGPNDTEFHIKADNSQHPTPQPDVGKALVYVAEDQRFQAVKVVTARVGLDGAWVGANRGNSYLFFSVEPGEHHLCTDWASSFLPAGRVVSLANFTAEAGKVYYFRARTSGGPASLLHRGEGSQYEDQAFIDLEQINSDEGKLLVASSVWSNSQPKNQRAKYISK